MKAFLKRFGLIIIILGILILTYAEFSKIDNNTLLLVSGGMILGGFLFYVVLNNILD